MSAGIAQNLHDVLERIAKACANCRRSPDSVRLVAVSKTMVPE
ncbi:MAG: YggS family pyridoxal phosphate enzyme, partial [Pseudomonadota bacterium]